MIGGFESLPSLLVRDYDVPVSCLKIDATIGELNQKADMGTGRASFGICAIGNFIYVIGGQDRKYKNLIK